MKKYRKRRIFVILLICCCLFSSCVQQPQFSSLLSKEQLNDFQNKIQNENLSEDIPSGIIEYNDILWAISKDENEEDLKNLEVIFEDFYSDKFANWNIFANKEETLRELKAYIESLSSSDLAELSEGQLTFALVQQLEHFSQNTEDNLDGNSSYDKIGLTLQEQTDLHVVIHEITNKENPQEQTYPSPYTSLAISDDNMADVFSNDDTLWTLIDFAQSGSTSGDKTDMITHTIFDLSVMLREDLNLPEDTEIFANTIETESRWFVVIGRQQNFVSYLSEIYQYVCAEKNDFQGEELALLFSEFLKLPK